MTRENKLALVVGFGLILFVGILISDHFSIARSQHSADMTRKYSIVDPLNGRRAGDPTYQNLIEPVRQEQPKVAMNNEVVPTSNGGSGRPSQEGINELASPEQRTQIDPNGTLTQGNGTTRQQGPDVIPVGNQPSPPFIDPPPTEVASNVQFHEVKTKESLFGICRQYYGDTALVKALAKYNKIDDATAIKVGRRLMIPPAEELGGKAMVTSVPPVTPNVKPATTGQTPVAPLYVIAETPGGAKSQTRPVTKNYTVKPGDSLTGIAQRVLGSKSKWRKLADLNSGVIEDEDNLQVGTVLTLPQLAERARQQPAMFAKLLLIITVVGATACSLLVIRQQRIDTFHEISLAHQRLLQHERTLWQLRSEIAQRCRPQQVRLVMNQLGGTWVPIPIRPTSLEPLDVRLAHTVAAKSTSEEPPKPQTPKRRGGRTSR